MDLPKSWDFASLHLSKSDSKLIEPNLDWLILKYKDHDKELAWYKDNHFLFHYQKHPKTVEPFLVLFGHTSVSGSSAKRRSPAQVPCSSSSSSWVQSASRPWIQTVFKHINSRVMNTDLVTFSEDFLGEVFLSILSDTWCIWCIWRLGDLANTPRSTTYPHPIRICNAVSWN